MKWNEKKETETRRSKMKSQRNQMNRNSICECSLNTLIGFTLRLRLFSHLSRWLLLLLLLPLISHAALNAIVQKAVWGIIALIQPYTLSSTMHTSYLWTHTNEYFAIEVGDKLTTCLSNIHPKKIRNANWFFFLTFIRYMRAPVAFPLMFWPYRGAHISCRYQEFHKLYDTRCLRDIMK